MNISAIKAYSSASGVRPSLPARSNKSITDGFDMELNNGETIGQSKEYHKQETTIRKDIEVFPKFNASGKIEYNSVSLGRIFDGKA